MPQGVQCAFSTPKAQLFSDIFHIHRCDRHICLLSLRYAVHARVTVANAALKHNQVRREGQYGGRDVRTGKETAVFSLKVLFWH